MAKQEELEETVLRQDEALLDNNRELQKYAVLKLDHQADARQHAKVLKSLEESQEGCKLVAARLEVRVSASKRGDGS